MSKKANSLNGEQKHFARAEILVIGYVQKAGYRAMVVEKALKRKLRGTVENLPDGTVKIIAEGQNESVREFIREINIRNQMIKVEEIRTRFCEPTGEFNWFGVNYSNLGHEVFQGFATAKNYFDNLGGKVDAVGGKVDTLGDKIDAVGDKVDSVGGKVEQGFERMDENFKSLDDKYHTVSEELKGIRKALEKRLTIEEEKVKYSAETKKSSGGAGSRV